MKKYTFLLLLTIPFTFACNSSKQTTTTAATPTAEATPPTNPRQAGPRDGQRGGQGQEQLQALIAELGLNEDQKEEWQAINQKYRGQMRTMREEANGDFSSMRGKMQELRAAQNEEIKAILTDEQYQKYEKFMAERRSNRRGRGPGGNN